MLLGHLRADLRDPVLDVGACRVRRRRRRLGSPAAARRAARARGLGDVEAVEQPVADEVEVRRHRRARLAVERAQRVEHAGRVAVGLEQRRRVGSRRSAR